ncbi:MAG: UTP--glucose-1-phosphate uridylyltransferase [Candidatus Peregrinibacteria bacterium]
MKIRKAVLPVGGVGTRFLPVTKVVPKELLAIGDKPVIQYLVEEAVASGVEEIIFVISKDKELIRAHFSPHPELEAFLTVREKYDLLNKVRPIHQLARFHYVYQNEPKGDGDALLCAEELVGHEPFLVLFGDDIVKSDIPAAKQLIDHFTGKGVIGVQRVPKERVSDYGIVSPGARQGRLFDVEGLVEKPAPENAPSDLGIIGKYVCPPEIFEAIRTAVPSHGGELRLIDGLMKLRESQGLLAYVIEGERFDTGQLAGWIAANNAFFGH